MDGRALQHYREEGGVLREAGRCTNEPGERHASTAVPTRFLNHAHIIVTCRSVGRCGPTNKPHPPLAQPHPSKYKCVQDQTHSIPPPHTSPVHLDPPSLLPSSLPFPSPPPSSLPPPLPSPASAGCLSLVVTSGQPGHVSMAERSTLVRLDRTSGTTNLGRPSVSVTEAVVDQGPEKQACWALEPKRC